MVLLVLFCGRARAGTNALSDWLVKGWTVDDGLPSTLVSVIAQSEDGYLWLGTDEGLVRFDGVRFVSSELEYPGATPLFNYHAKQLWVENANGDLLVREHNRFQQVPRPRGAQGQPAEVKTDADGTTWFQFGTDVYRWRGGRWLPADEHRTAPDYAGKGREGRPGEWWCSYVGQPGRWRQGSFQAARIPDESPGMQVAVETPGLDGMGWLLTKSGDMNVPYCLRSISPEMVVSQAIPLPWKGMVLLQDLLADRRGNVWISSATHGVLRYGADGDWEVFNSRHGLPTDVARVMLEDAEGNIWIATDGAGLLRLSRRTFRTFGLADGLTTDNVYAVAPAREGGIWAGTHGNHQEGLFRLQGGEVKAVPHMGPYAWSVLEDKFGDVWAGNFQSGLYRLHDGAPSMVPNTPASIFAMCEDGQGGIWYGGNGLGRVQKGQAGPVGNLPSDLNITSLVRDAGGTLWIGSDNHGLYSMQGGKVCHFTMEDGLPSNEVQCLYADNGNTLWAGTSGGIARRAHDHFLPLTQDNGLLPRLVSGLAEDGYGYMWIDSDKGIYRIARQELDAFFAGKINKISSVSYGRADGLATATSTFGTQPRICRDRDGRMWFATFKGAAVADPATMPLNTNPPPVVIEEIMVNGKLRRLRMDAQVLETPSGTRETFPPGSRLFEIHYTANSFCAPEKVRFRYRLEGINPEWVEAGEKRSVLLNNITHGDYHFEVTACNNDGVWSERPAAFAFTILPFFWQTLWFRSVVLLAAGTALALCVRWLSLRGVRRKLALAAQEAAVERERARISRDMHDDLGASLTKISILSELAGRSLNHREDAQAHLQTLSNLARNTAMSLGELIWTVKPVNDNVANLANHLCQCADEFLRETPIRCRFDIPDKLPDLPASAEVRQEVSLAIKEALNNVVKHSGATEVRLSFQVTPQGFVVILSDNGRGLDSGSIPTSLGGNGLPNMRRRLERIGGTCEFGTQAGAGLVVTLNVPNKSI